MLEHTNLLQRLHHLPIDAAAGIDVVRRPRAAVLLAAVRFPQPAYPDRLAQVHVSCHGRRARVEPRGVGRQ